MSLFQNQNQFAPTALLGTVQKDSPLNTKVVRIDPASVATGIQVGSPVKLVAKASSEIVVDIATSITADAIYGVINANNKKNKYVAGDLVEISCAGNVILLESTAAINRGDNVAIGNTSATGGGPGVTTDVTSTHQIGGVALGQASAAQQLIMVEIKPSKLP